ncbi:ABC transporter permease [Ectothiorhodospira mobilis]|uniref:ABC transporter permease n=1 Tax=Ectothiorhodospira mobilis TaxID=195064 RepID=UPI001906F91E|nr:ABC transporter permease [Ectothiorhodospira mobilis]MBK1692011.1 ABC transporter permease [Ectothiorhodospira mobilis]
MNLPLLLQFTREDFIDRYAGSVLGGLWAFIHPLVMIFIFVVVFANVMAARLPGLESSTYSYGIYLVSGLLPWMAFANTIGRCASVFLDKRALIGKIHLPLAQLPLYVVLSEAITFVIGYTLFLGFLIVTGHLPGAAMLLVPFLFLAQQILALGIGLIFAVFNVFFRDLKEMATLLTTLWFWFTPIVWVLDIVPPLVQDIQVHLNPAFLFVDAYHRVMVHGQIPEMDGLLRLLGIGAFVLLLAYGLLKALEKDIRDFL